MSGIDWKYTDKLVCRGTMRTTLKPPKNNTAVALMVEGFQGAFDSAHMQPRDAHLSDSYTRDRCSFFPAHTAHIKKNTRGRFVTVEITLETVENVRNLHVQIDLFGMGDVIGFRDNE